MRVELKNMKIDLNTNSKIERVIEIERHIRVIEDRARACCHSLPFNNIPKLILVALLMNYILWINIFPKKRRSFYIS